MSGRRKCFEYEAQWNCYVETEHVFDETYLLYIEEKWLLAGIFNEPAILAIMFVQLN